MKLLFILIFILLNTSNIFAQLQGQARIDSLIKELPKMQEDTNAVNLLGDLSFESQSTNPDKGIKYGLQGVELAKKLKWKRGEAAVNNSLGVNYQNKSNYPKALEYFYKALKINEELGNKDGISFNLGNIGILYAFQPDYPKALEYFHKALKNYEELGDEKSAAGTIHNIGVIYKSQSDYPKALEYFEKAKKINEKPGGNKIWLATNIGSIGNIYRDQSNYPKALEYIHKSLKIFEELGDKAGIAFNLGIMGSLYLKLSQDSVLSNISEGTELVSLEKEINLNRSIEFSLQAIEIYEEIGELNERSGLLKNLAKAYKQKGDYKKWGTYLEESHKLKDSVFNQDKSKELGKLEATHEMELAQKEQEIKEKEVARLKAEETSRRDNLQYSIITIITLFAFVVVYYLSRKNISFGVIDTLTFLSFLLIYEFILVFADPIVDDFTNGVPLYKLGINFGIALIFIPIHKIEQRFKEKLKEKDGIVS